MIIGYCRAGLIRPGASLARQRRRLGAAGARQIFCDKVGIRGAKPMLERAIQLAQAGDVIVITKSYRVAPSTRGVLALIHRLGRKGVGLRILDTPVDTSTTTGRMVLGSAPLWTLGISPLVAMMRDMALVWRPQR
jgi:DNA invertase Pin-like site-specific DNA recombinase